MPQSVPVPKRKGRGIIAWSLWALAGGLAAGPLLADYADLGLEAGVRWLAAWSPGFLRPYLPQAIEETTWPPQRPKVAPTPSAVPTVARAQIVEMATHGKPTAGIVGQRSGTRAPLDVAAARQAEPDRAVTQAQAHKTRAARKAPGMLAEAESVLPTTTARPADRRHIGRPNPFDGDSSAQIQAPASASVAKTAADPSPARGAPARSSDSLDDLMAGVTGEPGSKPQGRRSTSREIDAMLKDVQKTQPAPAPKRVEPAHAPSLTASDIARVMAGVKSGANACGRRFGERGVADLKLAVGKDGRVSDVVLRGKLADSSAGQCITKVVRNAEFPPSAGLKFDYRIDVQ